MWKRRAGIAFASALALMLTIAAVVVLVRATIVITAMPNPSLRVLAILAELVLGTLWLLGVIYAATHVAVLIFRKDQRRS